MKILMFSLLFMVLSSPLNSIPNGNRHIVRKGETLYSLAKKYNITVAVLAKANSISTRTEIKIGQQLLIPGLKSTKAVAKVYKPIAVPSTPDTPYREEDARPRSNVYVPRDVPATKPLDIFDEPKPVTEGLKTSSSNAADYPAIFNQYSMNGYFMKKNKGTANYIQDATSGNQNLAFYSAAETGSVIRVTNLMNHKTIFVKVVGKVPQLDAREEITIKLSNKAAQDLEATDEKFLVEVASFSHE